LEWHGSVQAYASAKKNILRFQQPEDYAVLNGRDRGAGELASEAVGHVIRYGLDDARPFALSMPGEHNQTNAQGAFAAAGIAGITWDEAQAALEAFTPLPHRLELVHESNGVRWYNDSIATIPRAAVAALESFPPKRVVQIIGGKDKHLAIEAMCAALAERAKAVLCIGATQELLTESLRKAGARVVPCGDLATAVSKARALAAEGDVVLLSPGYPSYDQFVNFEQRGETFRALARNSEC
jgi:UDP-N-acetylmuramoylalanine--D-glutamate ligase